MLKFPGKRPKNLGVSNGRFKAPPTWKPNWVSSQIASDDKHYIAPLLIKGDPILVLQKLKAILEKTERVVIVASLPDYLYAEFSTKGLGFTDDVEFAASGGSLHVRSSSRLGIRDFDVNRKRVESLRSQLGA